MATGIGKDAPGVVYGSAESREFWEWWGPRLDERERAIQQAKVEATFLEPERAAPVLPPRLLATPGQSFTPEPDRRAKQAIDGFPVRERKPRPDRVRIVELMRNRYGVCG